MNLIVFETTLDSCSLVYVLNSSKLFDPWFGTFPSTFSVGITILVDLAFIDAKVEVSGIKPEEFLDVQGIDLLVGHPAQDVRASELVGFALPDPALLLAPCPRAIHHFFGEAAVSDILLPVQNGARSGTVYVARLCSFYCILSVLYSSRCWLLNV